jgi:hypothetical protein
MVTTFSRSIVCHSRSKSGLKKGLSWILHLISRGDSPVNLFIRCKLRQRRDLRIQKGNESSNPNLSAMQSALRRNSLVFIRNKRIMPVFRDSCQANRTAENGLLGSEAATVPAFL